MELLVKIAVAIILVWIAIQDIRTREVWNYHFVIYGVTGAYLFYNNSHEGFFLASIGINLSIVSVIVFVKYLVAKFLLKKKFLSEALGLGDILFYVAFALSFPPVSFLNFLFFSALFAFVLYMFQRTTKMTQQKTIPLAGSMSLFLAAVYLINWMGYYDSIYIL